MDTGASCSRWISLRGQARRPRFPRRCSATSSGGRVLPPRDPVRTDPGGCGPPRSRRRPGVRDRPVPGREQDPRQRPLHDLREVAADRHVRRIHRGRLQRGGVQEDRVRRSHRQGQGNQPRVPLHPRRRGRIHNTSHLWGKMDAYETEDAIKAELGDDKIRVAPIGAAGENLVRFAGVICNYGHGCAGRTGMGAVMGSKNLKALAFRGTQTVPIARPAEADRARRDRRAYRQHDAAVQSQARCRADQGLRAAEEVLHRSHGGRCGWCAAPLR